MADLDRVVEFLNTLDERTFRRHGEHHVGGEQLTSPQALSDWLADGTEARPADLRAAIALRTALRESDPATLADFPVRLTPGPAGHLRLAAATGRPWLDEIVEAVAASVARDDWKRVKLCDAPDCRWAFHDTSRNGRGRWCEMGVCGNRHKTRAYRERELSRRGERLSPSE
ncbi:CGNR zinc finger domain-containing protein [Paractinoplanes ovalisporus]|uniref:CGNR zinc finger domain-containing protein n=1 Tax=Paractinoplanes ovalisporus TaxID=2810368 RepID=UPI0027DD352C|nr:CGNR zinc finger domain-containing protein [Actinoplanes ovalisporus]